MSGVSLSNELVYLSHIRHGFGVAVPGADQPSAGVGYFEGAAEYAGASAGVHVQKGWNIASLEGANEEGNACAH